MEVKTKHPVKNDAGWEVRPLENTTKNAHVTYRGVCYMGVYFLEEDYPNESN